MSQDQNLSHNQNAEVMSHNQNAEVMSPNENPEIDSVVGPGYRVYDNQLPPELSGTLEVPAQKLTVGSFAEVYQGKWIRPDEPPAIVAIKRVTLPGKSIPEEQFRTRIKRETVIWAMAKHPNILPFIGYQMDDTGVPMLVSPWCENGNLSTYIKARPNFPRPERVKLLHGAACGLTYLHTLVPPIVHGDIKPENIIIQDNLEAGLCDFGISKIVVVAGQRSGLTTTGSTLGTKGYQAAEVLQDEPVTIASDVYAFGGVILFAMSGKAPFEGKSTAAVVMAVITGKTPPRREYPLLPPTDSMWDVYEACSVLNPEGRPSMPVLVPKLKEEMPGP
ncbi:hypothetical protein FRC04_002952 [Tulasnella sp. 424]|nr:hypothetical protein FRC04_002952 [Tulasnella sp. 424]